VRIAEMGRRRYSKDGPPFPGIEHSRSHLGLREYAWCEHCGFNHEPKCLLSKAVAIG